MEAEATPRQCPRVLLDLVDLQLLLDQVDSEADSAEGLVVIVVEVDFVVGSEAATVVGLVEDEEASATRAEAALVEEAEVDTADHPMASVMALHHLPMHLRARVVGPAFLVGMAVVALADHQLTAASTVQPWLQSLSVVVGTAILDEAVRTRTDQHTEVQAAAVGMVTEAIAAREVSPAAIVNR